MRILKYGYLGEDDAQKIFLKNYLATLCSNREDFRFEFDEYFLIEAQGISDVERRFVEAVQVGISVHQQDIFFIGIDLDDQNYEKLQPLFEKMKAKLDKKLRSKTCIFIPIQAIEHWLWYLKVKKENPNSNKNEPFEKQPRPRAKEVVYGSKRPSNEVSNPIVNALSENLAIAWLESRSASFSHFHQQVTTFLKAF
jgi:hypothetical protein